MWELRITNMGIGNFEILNLSGMAESHPGKVTLPNDHHLALFLNGAVAVRAGLHPIKA